MLEFISIPMAWIQAGMAQMIGKSINGAKKNDLLQPQKVLIVTETPKEYGQ